MSGFEQQQDIGHTVQTTGEVDSNPNLGDGLDGFFASILREEVKPYELPKSGTTTPNSLPLDQGMTDWINRSFADSPTPTPAAAPAYLLAPDTKASGEATGRFSQENISDFNAEDPRLDDQIDHFINHKPWAGIETDLAERYGSPVPQAGSLTPAPAPLVSTTEARPTPPRYITRPPAPIVPPESADPLNTPEKKPSRLRRTILAGGAALAAVGLTVIGVFSLFGEKDVQPKASAEQTTSTTEFTSTTMTPDTTSVPGSIKPGAGEYKPTTTIPEVTTTTAPEATSTPDQTKGPESEIAQPTPQKVSSTLELTVQKGDNLYDLAQEEVAGRSDVVVDKDPLVAEFTNEVLAIIAKQKGKTRAQLNTVYTGNHFQVPLTPELQKLRDEIEDTFNLASNRTS